MIVHHRRQNRLLPISQRHVTPPRERQHPAFRPRKHACITTPAREPTLWPHLWYILSYLATETQTAHRCATISPIMLHGRHTSVLLLAFTNVTALHSQKLHSTYDYSEAPRSKENGIQGSLQLRRLRISWLLVHAKYAIDNSNSVQRTPTHQ